MPDNNPNNNNLSINMLFKRRCIMFLHLWIFPFQNVLTTTATATAILQIYDDDIIIIIIKSIKI